MISTLLFKMAGALGVIRRYEPALGEIAKKPGMTIHPRDQKYMQMVEGKVERATRKSSIIAELDRRKAAIQGAQGTQGTQVISAPAPLMPVPITDPIQPFAASGEQRLVSEAPTSAKNLGRRRGDMLKQSGIWDKLNQPIGHWAPLDKLIARARGAAQGVGDKVQGAVQGAQKTVDDVQAMRGILARAKQVHAGPAGKAFDFVGQHPKLAIGAGAALGLGVPMGMGYLGGRLAQPSQQENA